MNSKEGEKEGEKMSGLQSLFNKLQQFNHQGHKDKIKKIKNIIKLKKKKPNKKPKTE